MDVVKAATNFSRSGLTDWIIQRLTAVILAVYVICVLGFLMLYQPVTYQSWQLYILSTPMRVFSVLALLSILAHAWIGLWTVATDYITHQGIRLFFHAFYLILLAALLVWGIGTVWS